MLGGHVLKSRSSTQKPITLSSGEAELVAAVKMSTELIGISQLAWDWGMAWACDVHVDSSAAIGVTNRKGNGKMRHVRVGMLWIQEKVEEGELGMKKVRGEDNPSGVLTKYVSANVNDKHMVTLHQEYREERAEESLELQLN